MKKNLFLSICILFFLITNFSSCTNSKEYDIKGFWEVTLREEQQLIDNENFDLLIGEIYLDQKNTFIFLDDGNFERIIDQKIFKAISYDDEMTNEELFNLYSSQNHFAKINGKYNLKGNKLTLINEKIVYDNTEFTYEEFFNMINVFGNTKTQIKIKIDENENLIIEGIPFKKIQ